MLNDMRGWGRTKSAPRTSNFWGLAALDPSHSNQDLQGLSGKKGTR